MHATLIKPRISGNRQEYYVNSVKTEPLAIAVVAGLLPAEVEVAFYDDRFEAIPFDRRTDWVGITVDTYTAKRAYAIAAEYRARGVPVVLGGYHPTLLPEEAEQHADAIVVGEAENLMEELVADLATGRLRRRYHSTEPADLGRIRPRRELFRGKPYVPVSVVEFGRGCKYRCDFCCIHRFYGGGYRPRPVAEVLAEIATLPNKRFIFADDNLVNSPASIRPLLKGLVTLGKEWGAQVTIDVAKDDELLALMRRSGCRGLLLGLESLSNHNLAEMNKRATREGYERAMERIQAHGLMVDGSFIAGYAGDRPDAFREEIEFAERQGLLLAGFNHLMPLPGTELYERLQREGRLLYERWWLEQEAYFGSIAYRPVNMTPDQLAAAKFDAFRRFYRLGGILRRLRRTPANWRSPGSLLLFLAFNLAMWWKYRGDKGHAYPSHIGRHGAVPLEAGAEGPPEEDIA